MPAGVEGSAGQPPPLHPLLGALETSFCFSHSRPFKGSNSLIKPALERVCRCALTLGDTGGSDLAQAPKNGLRALPPVLWDPCSASGSRGKEEFMDLSCPASK